MEPTATTQVQPQAPAPAPTPQERAAAEALRVFRERVFRGIRWSGWQVNRKGEDEAIIAVIYALEQGKPVGFKRTARISSVANMDDHILALRDAAVDFVEDFVAANRNAGSIEIVTNREDPMFDKSPMTKAGLLVVELSGGQAPGPEPIEVIDEDEAAALAALEAERAAAEVNVREYGVPKPSRLDVIKSVLRRRAQ